MTLQIQSQFFFLVNILTTWGVQDILEDRVDGLIFLDDQGVTNRAWTSLGPALDRNRGMKLRMELGNGRNGVSPFTNACPSNGYVEFLFFTGHCLRNGMPRSLKRLTAWQGTRWGPTHVQPARWLLLHIQWVPKLSKCFQLLPFITYYSMMAWATRYF
jgi:hypothetical protein